MQEYKFSFVTLFAIFILIPSLFISTLRADEIGSWSFDDYPQPALSQMNLLEQLAILNAKKQALNPESSCRRSLQVEYQIYLGRYPRYTLVWDEGERYGRWKRHMAQNLAVQDLTCLYQVLYSDLSKLNSSKMVGKDFVFCGKYSRAPKNHDEIGTKKLIDELVMYANFGMERAVKTFHRLTVFIYVFDIPVDLNYYFYNLANKSRYSKSLDMNLAELKKNIPRARIAFLDAAVQRQDYRSVIDTLPACEPILH